MPVFEYTARDSGGRMVRGNQEAVSEEAAVTMLQNRGLIVTNLVSFAQKKTKAYQKKRRKRIRLEDLHFFVQQTGNLINVGIPLVRSLEVVSDQVQSARLLEVIRQMMSNIQAGSTLHDAMARHPNVFPDYWPYLIEAGEVSGTLPQILLQLAKNLEATQNLRKKIVSALIYPSVLIAASCAAILIFMVFVIPIFEKLFKSFNAQLPPLTQFILDFSKILQQYLFVIIAGLVLLSRLFTSYIRTPMGRKTMHAFLLNAPVISSVTKDIVHARICIILSMLIRSGLSFLKSLEIASNVSGNYFFETALASIRQEIQQGKTFSNCLEEHPIFDPMFVNLVKIGEEGGRLPEMTEKAGEFFESRVDVFSSRVSILIEPFIMVFVGSTIGVIAVSLFLPIIKLSSSGR